MSLTTELLRIDKVPDMSDDVPRIYKGRQPKRPHHVQSWAEKRGLKPGELAEEIGVDKSLVSRWYSGSTPSEESLAKLGAFFGIEPEALFRDPDEDWLARMLRGRDREEIERIKSTIEMAFPRKVS